MTDADPWRSLGTRGGHVEIVEYSLDWPLVFEREAAAIMAVCRPWVTEVHHVGSTSVPGLAAKPVLDMMPIAAGPAEGLEAVPRMTALGYLYSGENGIPGRFYFDRVASMAARSRTSTCCRWATPTPGSTWSSVTTSGVIPTPHANTSG